MSTNTDTMRHLLAAVDSLHERVRQLEEGMEGGMLDRIHNRVSKVLGRGGAMDQRGVLEVLHRFDAGARATSTHDFAFTLKGKPYTAKLGEAHEGASLTVTGPDGARGTVATTDDLATWLKGQLATTMAAPPEGSRLLRYTQAILAQQGARPGEYPY